MRAQTRERAAAGIAGRQHGVITYAQLRGAEFSASAVDRLRVNGWLHPEFRGVYRWGHRAPSVEARYLAAVLACGDEAWLSGFAAAHHLVLVRRPPRLPEVTSLIGRSLDGLVHHRASRPPAHVTWRAIPTTSVPQTLVDLAPHLSLDALARVAHEADVKHRVQPEWVLPLAVGRPGARKLRLIFEGDHQTVLSELERRFCALLRTAKLPAPLTNRRKGWHYVDCRWPAHRLTVELDSFRFHRSRHAWQQDHRRERAARARGDEFRRYTWEDVVEDPSPMLAELVSLLAL